MCLKSFIDKCKKQRGDNINTEKEYELEKNKGDI